MNRKNGISAVQLACPLQPARTVAFSGIEAKIILSTDERTPFTLMYLTVAAETGAPAHISSVEDKLFLITSGVFQFQIDDCVTTVTAGDSVFVRKGEAHSFRSLTEPASTMFLVSNPPMHERFFTDMSELPVPHQPEDVHRVSVACSQEIVGPIVQQNWRTAR